jgi:hypothetical protein
VELLGIDGVGISYRPLWRQVFIAAVTGFAGDPQNVATYAMEVADKAVELYALRFGPEPEDAAAHILAHYRTHLEHATRQRDAYHQLIERLANMLEERGNPAADEVRRWLRNVEAGL